MALLDGDADGPDDLFRQVPERSHSGSERLPSPPCLEVNRGTSQCPVMGVDQLRMLLALEQFGESRADELVGPEPQPVELGPQGRGEDELRVRRPEQRRSLIDQDAQRVQEIDGRPESVRSAGIHRHPAKLPLLQ